MGCIVVSGAPGSGKSTLARALSVALGRPLLSKDTIKEALMDTLPVVSIEESQTLGAAATMTLYALAYDNPSAILESVWHRELAIAELTRGGWPVLTVSTEERVDVEQLAASVQALER